MCKYGTVAVINTRMSSGFSCFLLHSVKNCFRILILSDNSANNVYSGELEPELVSLEATDDDKCDSDTKTFFT